MVGIYGRANGRVWWLMCIAVAACSVHDPELLEKRSSASSVDKNLDQADDHAFDAGAGGALAPAPLPQAICGDGRLGGDELCDTGIAEGMPGACPPPVCEPLSECRLRVRRGEGCQAACVLLPEACANGDRCCPSVCTAETDNDCSQRCGDGQVQPEQETCEDGTDTPCPTLADCDDGDSCTEDRLIGSADNCNAECEHVAITSLATADACCPAGANANSDPDCMAVCGNGVRESDEECDGPEGCDETCAVSETPEQRDCLDRLATDACLSCSCISCTDEMFGCFDSGESERDTHCGAINQCARDNDCVDRACYCGESAACLTPDGPCVDAIDNAASVPGPLVVDQEGMDPETAIGRAKALSACNVINCSDVCP